MKANVILDPTDATLFHTDVTCGSLWLLAARVESSLGSADDPEALVEQAAADGLLVLDGAVGGLRRCRRCCGPAAPTAGGGWARAA